MRMSIRRDFIEDYDFFFGGEPLLPLQVTDLFRGEPDKEQTISVRFNQPGGGNLCIYLDHDQARELVCELVKALPSDDEARHE